MKIYFKTLGIKEGASQEEIKTAYDKLSKELDPANNNDQEFFVEEYQKVQEAYEALCNSSILATEKGAKLNTARSNYGLKTSNDSVENKKKKNMFTYIFNRKRNILTFVVLVFILKLVLHFFLFSEIEEKINYDKKIYTNTGSLDYYVYENDSLVKNTSTYSFYPVERTYRQEGTGKVITEQQLLKLSAETGLSVEEIIQVNNLKFHLKLHSVFTFTKKGEQYVFEPGECEKCLDKVFYYPKEIRDQSFKAHLQKIFSNKPYIFLISICTLLLLVTLFNDKIKAS